MFLFYHFNHFPNNHKFLYNFRWGRTGIFFFKTLSSFYLLVLLKYFQNIFRKNKPLPKFNLMINAYNNFNLGKISNNYDLPINLFYFLPNSVNKFYKIYDHNQLKLFNLNYLNKFDKFHRHYFFKPPNHFLYYTNRKSLKLFKYIYFFLLFLLLNFPY